MELENLRITLAREHNAPPRTDPEAAILGGQLNVARADLMARNARLENFEASVHLTTYEVGGDRWSLAALDKQIARRREDTKLIPERAAHLNWRSLARLNYSQAARQQASADVERLINVRDEVVRQIEQRRQPLIADRDLAREVLDVLDSAHELERVIIRTAGPCLTQNERYQISTGKARRNPARFKANARSADGECTPPGRSGSIGRKGGCARLRRLGGGTSKERLQRFLIGCLLHLVIIKLPRCVK